MKIRTDLFFPRSLNLPIDGEIKTLFVIKADAQHTGPNHPNNNRPNQAAGFGPVWIGLQIDELTKSDSKLKIIVPGL